ncbi:hypothetical protein D3Y55_21035 [Mesorhizobium sp. DCY119]|nr:hypothetical protein D3Y55_21035 [Mesorhizobium sp. DCY119]
MVAGAVIRELSSAANVWPGKQEIVARAILAERKRCAEANAAEVKKQVHRATNAEYLMHAYRNMLGEKGRAVADMWDAKRVTRVHFSWGPDAHKLTGEERAQVILDLESAPRREVLNIDGEGK